MRILLVEDDLMIGDVVANSLRDASYAVDWMKNGNDALASCFAQHYDIVLLDLGLPGQDGFSVMNALRRQGSSVPVVIVTARDALTDRLHGLDSGADDYLIKPFEFSELLARISEEVDNFKVFFMLKETTLMSVYRSYLCSNQNVLTYQNGV